MSKVDKEKLEEEAKIYKNRKTHQVVAGSCLIGTGQPISTQSMCATHTTDIKATLTQIRLLEKAGASLIRIAVDSKKEVAALKEIRKETEANLVVDLQESYRLAKDIAPIVDKIRYNPGHLHHHQKELDVKEKVKFLADTAGEHGIAMRVGVNFGSLDPAQKKAEESSEDVALNSAAEHSDYLEEMGFKNYVVSLKSSDPLAVIKINKKFAKLRPQVPLHLGVTEAGLIPDGVIKTRIAFEQLISLGIGETVRVSLTLPDAEKDKEILVAKEIIEDVKAGRFRSVPDFLNSGLNVISCPSCSRVENSKFVELAMEVKKVTEYAKKHDLTIAVMGCRVNGPGETDDADLGLWCAPNFVNLKKGEESLGAYKYDEVIAKLLEQVDLLIEGRAGV